jgi:type II secretory pathway pseudopilin PulG
MSRSNPRRRAYTLAELLSVMFVLSLALTAVAGIIGPLLRSQSQTQAKVDTVQAAAMAFYRIQRDLRNSDAAQLWVCTIGASPTCTRPAATLTTTQAIVVQTAYQNGTGRFQLTTTGAPLWQGATVYWVDSQGNLDVAFDRPSSYTVGGNLTQADAQNAVTDVTTRGGMQLARFLQQISLAFPGAGFGHSLSFQMKAQSTVNGAYNETTYETDVETRN